MKLTFLLLVAALIVLLYKNWLLPGNLSGGDSVYYFQESYTLFSLHPYAWSTNRGVGLGQTNVPLLWGYEINALPITVLGNLGLGWSAIDRLIYYLPFLFLSFYSSWYFAKKTLVNEFFSFFSGFIYTTNTYILMTMGGGQTSYGLAYALAPIVLYKFISLFILNSTIKSTYVKSSIIFGLLLTVLTMLDPRVTYMVLLMVGVYSLVNIDLFFKGKSIAKILFSTFFIYILPMIITCLLLSYWIFPTVVGGANPVMQLGPRYMTQAEGVKYFSFAKLENTIGLLHPNWPENIFGKVSFMPWEFLILPLLAYTSLLFLEPNRQIHTRMILFLTLLGLLGAYLAKGANDPFGEVYLWMFTKIPGFNAFRDPTKWYVLIAISYSLLIPYTIQKITHFYEKI